MEGNCQGPYACRGVRSHNTPQDLAAHLQRCWRVTDAGTLIRQYGYGTVLAYATDIEQRADVRNRGGFLRSLLRDIDAPGRGGVEQSKTSSD